MLFRKKHPRSCQYCKHGTNMENQFVLCAKRGVVNSENGCRRFSYDPCKRVPPRPKALDFQKFNEDDFSL